MTEYEKNLPIEVAYPPIKITNHLTEILNQYNKKILKVAETEKYAHVTYFFNGNQENLFPNETQKLIASNIVTHYDETPEMQSEKITETIIEGIKSNYDLIVANYSNADMIGHTGNLKAGIKAVEAIDKALKPLIKLAKNGDCLLIITADHGNIEQMVNLYTGEPKTEHTLNPAPFYLIGNEFEQPAANSRMQADRYSFDIPEGMLSDIAPTILELMQIPQPPEMTGKSLLDVLK
jgi:2,3-bisphosphoglycerate-independent phosphoglycerate mutase